MTMKLLLVLSIFALSCALHAAEKQPNIVIIYADDLGYGDLGCKGATKLKTPRIDQLAAQGRRFTDAHSASATCTPSRFAMLSGKYPWRENLWSPVFIQSPLVLKHDTFTLADLAKSAGHTTAIFGKWHLGFGEQGPPDWNAELKPGPLELGFDHYFGVPVVNSHPPFVYVEDHRVVGLDPNDPLVVAPNAVSPTAKFEGKNVRPPRRGGLGVKGGAAAHALYKDEEISTTLAAKAADWITQNKDRPFLLCLMPTGIHHPCTPHPRFQGTSECGVYGDFVHELDWMVGEVLDTLDRHGLTDNTLVIFTSDNGGMLHHDGQQAWEAGHRMNGDQFGFKFDAWEGGHRVPFIVRWPGHVPAGTTSDHLISSIDLIRTLASVLKEDLPADAAPDSFDMLSEFLGTAAKPVRNHLLVMGHQKTHLALRTRHFLYIPAQGGGGFGNGLTFIARTGETTSDITPAGKIKPDAPTAQVFNLTAEGSQRENVVFKNLKITADLKSRLETLRASERTAP